MKKVGILYICTGSYTVFWENFYKSFEAHFLKECELHYFVFTDDENLYDAKSNPRIHLYGADTLPWPLVTLFRFHTFLSAEEELKKMDYLMFSNANMECVADVTAAEFLPREEKGEKLFVTMHPGYTSHHVMFAPYERSRKSYAYVPYHRGRAYVIGAMNGGCAEAFLRMCHTLQTAIEEDLKQNVIARWHDESHLNRYIIDRKDYRLLPASYCYPFGMDVSYEKKIAAVSKQDKFDVNRFKGVYAKQKHSLKKRAVNGCKAVLAPVLMCMLDAVCNRKVRTYEF